MAQGDALARVEAVYIADDASTDKTTEVATNTWKPATPLRILRPEKNRGEYVNVNDAVAQLPHDIDWFLIMHADNIAKSLAAAVGIDLTLSKTDGLLKLDEHLNALLGPPPVRDTETPEARAVATQKPV